MPWQNQHLSSCRFLMRLRYSAEHQWFVRIWVAVRAMAFLALSMQDFFGGGGGIARAPWLAGLSFQACLAVRNFSDT